MGEREILTLLAAAVAGWAACVAVQSSSVARRAAGATALLTGRIAAGLPRSGRRETRGPDSRHGRSARRHLPLVAGGTLVAAPAIGVATGMVVGAALAGAVELARRRRAARANAAIDRATRSLAQALAASLAAGNSVHGALAAAPASVDAPLRPHLERAARELALGYALDGVLERLTERAGAPRLRVIVGALIMQRRAGGDLVRLLGELAESFRRDDQALDQARSATTQARLTAWIVIGAPLGVALMAELVWPGALTGVLAAPAALMVFVLALAMHGVGAWLVVRLAGVRA